MKWIITKDHLDGSNEDFNRTGYGTIKSIDEIPADKRIPFKLYDDDNELYYTGIAETGACDTEEGFEPLDWAMCDAGCTEIKYRNKTTGIWETL